MKRSKIHAFTLIELSIVLVIIGLVVAVIIGGQNLIEASKKQKLIGEVQSYKTVLMAFSEQYGSYPGDFGNAGSFWPSCDATPSNCNGDEDGEIEWSNESFRAWQQLSDAGYLQRTYTGDSDGDSFCNIATNTPASDYRRATGYKFMDSTTLSASGLYVHSRVGNALTLGSGEYLNNESTDGTSAYSIDKKIDDGEAATGDVTTSKATGTSNNVCLLTAPDPDAYNIGNTVPACVMYFFFK